MFDYVILGTIQGIFEWIPISSQGMVAVTSRFLLEGVNALQIALFSHLGTFLAVLIYFRKEWTDVLTFKDKTLLRFLVIAVTISGVVGFIVYQIIKDAAIGSSLLALTGFGLLFTAFFHKFKKVSGISLSKLAVISGILQGLAVIPGLSRSGATIFGLSFGKLGPAEILKISYMMSAPAVLGMGIFLFLQNPVLVLQSWPVLIFSFLFGFLTLKFLLRISAKINFFRFALLFAFLCFLGAGLEMLN